MPLLYPNRPRIFQVKLALMLVTAAPSNFHKLDQGPGFSSGKPATIGQMQQDSSSKLTTWKGQPVTYRGEDPCYKGDDGSWHKIWFGHGPPVFTKNIELPETLYSVSVQDDYRYLKEKGAFKGGVMPEIPPRKEWCTWDF